MTRKQWEDSEGKLVHMTVLNIIPWGDTELKIECHIHEVDEYFEFNIQTEIEELASSQTLCYS